MANVRGGEKLSQIICIYSRDPCRPETGSKCSLLTMENNCVVHLSDENTICELDPGKPTDSCADRSIICLV